MKTTQLGSIFGLLLLVFVFDETAFSMTTYDAFNSSMINGIKWEDQEFVREIRQAGGNNKLFSMVTSYGTNNSNHLYVRNYGGIYYLEADVALISAVAPFDATQTTYSHAGLAGVFYNDGTAGSGSEGDILG